MIGLTEGVTLKRVLQSKADLLRTHKKCHLWLYTLTQISLIWKDAKTFLSRFCDDVELMIGQRPGISE